MLQTGQEKECSGLPSEEISSGEAVWWPDDLERACELQQRPGGRKRSQKHKHVQIHQLQQQVQDITDTLQGLLQAPDQLGGFLEGPGRAAKRPCHPDKLSLAVSGALEAGESPQSSDLEEPLESDLWDEASRTSESVPLDPLVRAIVARVAEHARLQPSALPLPPSVFDRDLRRRGRSEGLPVFPDFMSELLSSWGSPNRASLPRTHQANLEGATAYVVATAPRVGPTFPMLAGATVRVGCNASHPNSRCRATDGQLCKAYNALAMVARLACSNSLLLVYLEGLLQDLSSTAPAEGSKAVVEMLRVVDILIRGASKQAQALGQAIASLVQARRQVWLAQSKLTLRTVVFGSPSEAALEQSRKTRELMHSVQRTPAVSKPRPSRKYVWGHGGGALGSVPLSTRRVSGPWP